MHKKILFAVLILFAANHANAQLEMDQGKVNLAFKLGTGFLQTNKFNVNSDLVKYEDFKANGLAVGGSFELALWDNISLGCDINYAKYKSDVTGVQPGAAATGFHQYGDMSVLAFLFNVKYFTPIKVNKLATYAKLDILPFGVFKRSNDIDYSTGASSFGGSTGVKMTYGIYAGGDWELTRNIGVFAEVGYGYTALNTGLRLTVAR